MSTTSQNLRRLRDERQLSQESLARLAGVRGQTVYRIENGKTLGARASLVRLAAALGVSLDELIGDEPGDTDAADRLPDFDKFEDVEFEDDADALVRLGVSDPDAWGDHHRSDLDEDGEPNPLDFDATE